MSETDISDAKTSSSNVDFPLQTRAASFLPATANTEARSIDMVWSTGAPVRRRDWQNDTFYNETLSLDPGECDLTRLNSGAPFLNNHSAYDVNGVMGVIERAWISDGVNGREGRATVRFSTRDDVTPIWNDISSGIIRNVSVGYQVRAYSITTQQGQLDEWRATSWSPLEISAVPIGADPGAGFRAAGRSFPCQLNRKDTTSMADTAFPPVDPSPAVEITQVRSDASPPPPATAQEPAAPAPAPVQTRSYEPAPAPQMQTQPAPADTGSVERAVAVERARSAGIYSSGEKLGLTRAFCDDLVTRGVSLDEARSQLIDEAGRKDSAVETRSVTQVTQDEQVTRRAAVENAILSRFNEAAYPLTPAAKEWRGLTLLEMSRSYLTAAGVNVRGLSRDEIATRALHTGSDFPIILAGVTNRTLRAAYEAAPRTFLPFCRQVTANDFKTIYRVQMGEAPNLMKVAEGGEITRGTVGEAQETYKLESFARIFSITRQVLINDDLNAFTRVPQMFGDSAARLESDTVWNLFIQNKAMISDGKPLFDAAHKNVAASGSILSVASVAKARVLMSRQVGLDGKSLLNLRPAFLIVPSALELSAEQLIAVNLVPRIVTDVVPNSIRSLQVISEPRLDDNSTTAWYMAANSSQIDTIEYAYLEGNQGVMMETRLGFEVDGLEIKARLDFGAKAIDWRGFTKDPGAAPA